MARRYGEIKRSRTKVGRRWAASWRSGARKGPTIVTVIERGGGGNYGASACVRSRDWKRSPSRCAHAQGPTPSAALATAVRKVSAKFRFWKSV